MTQIDPQTDDPCPLIRGVRAENGAVVVEIVGAIEFEQSPALRAELMRLVAEHRPTKLIANMAGVTHIGSAGLAAFIEAIKVMRRTTGGTLYMTDLRPPVRALLEIGRLDALFNPVADVAEAMTK